MDLLTPNEIAQLWESLENEQLERRLASLDEERRNGVTWASLKAELERRCP